MLTVSELRNILNYDPDTGFFTWRINKGQRGRVGLRAGGFRTDGYGTIKINGHHHKSHRLAWLHFYGTWPEGDTDHIDGNPSNNAIHNLRDVPHAINMQNRRSARKQSKTGIIGVTVRKDGQFCAQLMTSGKQKHLGLFDTKEQAQAAYLYAKRDHHLGCTI